MTTEDGQDVWLVFRSRIWSSRGHIVHGNPIAPPREVDVAAVIAWVEQMMGQLSMRLVVAGRHAMHDLVVAALDEARTKIEQNTVD